VASLNWSQCPAVESVAGKRSGELDLAGSPVSGVELLDAVQGIGGYLALDLWGVAGIGGFSLGWGVFREDLGEDFVLEAKRQNEAGLPEVL
jgi:hypothetical protein